MKINEAIEKLERERNNTRFAYLIRVCQEHFGNARVRSSHHIFKTPWQGDPRINVQKVKGYAKPYQVDQVIEALQKLQEMQELKKRQPATRDAKSGSKSYVA